MSDLLTEIFTMKFRERTKEGDDRSQLNLAILRVNVLASSIMSPLFLLYVKFKRTIKKL